MVRINCHSAFKHYEIFHNSCCGGGNYGSIFNTTYNLNCSGHGGGFWSGFGAGLGNAFGNIFSGFFGGGGFGMPSFGGFGMGGFGMPSFGGFGGFPFLGGWQYDFGGDGSGSRKVRHDSEDDDKKTKKSSDKSKESKCEDKDQAKILDFTEQINKLKDDDLANAKKLYDEIKAKAEKPIDKAHEKDNKKQYEALARNLEKQFPNLKNTTPSLEVANPTDKADALGNGDNKTPKTTDELIAGYEQDLANLGNNPTAAQLQALKDDIMNSDDYKKNKDKYAPLLKKINDAIAAAQASEAAAANIDEDNSSGLEPIDSSVNNLTTISGAQSLDELPKYGDLKSEAEKTAYIDKCFALANSDLTTPEDLKAFLESLPQNARLSLKKKFYGSRTNYDGKTSIESVKLVHDTGLGAKADIKTFVNKEQTEGAHPTKITMKTSYGVPVEYTCSGKNDDGEYVYTSNKNEQEYILQNDGDDYVLVEYKWHEGWNEADVKRTGN